MDEIEIVKIVLARKVLDNYGTLMFPEAESGVFVDGKRLPAKSIMVVIDKDEEYVSIKIPMRVVDLEVINIQPSQESSIDWES